MWLSGASECVLAEAEVIVVRADDHDAGCRRASPVASPASAPTTLNACSVV